ncbi:NADP-dependent oxidoreductase [Flindersiella endophytica]
MQALQAKEYGPPEGLSVEEVDPPAPGPGQILVRIAAASANPGELRLLSGELREQIPLVFPHVPGHDFAGTVTELGANVTRFAVGDEVFGFAAPRAFPGAEMVSTPPSYSTGTVAEYAVFEADTPALGRRPTQLPADQAAALPTTGMTAWPLLRQLDPRPGQTILVIGATGGVGTVLLPLLATAGAHILATAGPADESAIRALGAAEVLDHTSVDVVAEVARHYPDGVDALVNLALPSSDEVVAAARVVRRGGRLITITSMLEQTVPGRDDLTVWSGFTHIEPGDLDELAVRVVDGRLPLTISRRYPLAEARQAYVDLLREHTFGKLVITVP